jgi:hypothetical protein
MSEHIDRRNFLLKTGALGTLSAGLSLSFQDLPRGPAPVVGVPEVGQGQLPYKGPNVIVVRFGGGVRRQETILDPEHTYCPFIYHELYRRQGGLLFPNMEIAHLSDERAVTSHGQGTLYILTGQYAKYEDVEHGFLKDRFEPKSPTFFEYFRRRYQVPAHQCLIVNGEDRINEEFYTFSICRPYGIEYRSNVLSLYRFKTYLLRKEIESGRFDGEELAQKRRRLAEMENLDYRAANRERVASPEMDDFWAKWQAHYGPTGFVNPRGDRLLTTLALWAIRELRPKLMMINYQDPDYVHWGPRAFYTRAISIIDEGVREIYTAVQNAEAYRDNTVFVIVPDCGRDSNRCMPVPYQHHFNAHDIFALIAGPRHLIPHEHRPVDRLQQQTFVARTLGQIMRFDTEQAETQSLLDAV